MRNLRTEQEIIANWKGDIFKPVVSVCCTAYNHQAYIEDALEGFLIQKTDFPFEIIIHDDASTDNTVDIIKDYTEKYPLIIKPIFQKVNQYTKNVHLPFKNICDHVKGEYIAICEGDDYWIRAEKLQYQVRLLRKYPKINISFHPAYKVVGKHINREEIFSNYGDDIKICNPEEVILGGGGFMPTSSILVKASSLKSESLQTWLDVASVGDIVIQINSSLPEGAIYFPDKFSIYRTSTSGSWSSAIRNIEKMYEHRRKMTKFFLFLAAEVKQYRKPILKVCRKANLRFFYQSIKSRDLKHLIKAIWLFIGGKR